MVEEDTMNLNQLYYFKKLAELEHYTRASEELSITQPSLSHAIATLEKELEVQLFRKVGRNVILTKYGKVFLKYVEESLLILEEGVRKTKALAGNETGTIDLGYIYTMGPRFIPKLVQGYTENYPNKKIRFSFSQGNSTDIVKGLIKGKHDLVIGSKISDVPDVEFIPITRQELVVIVPKGHPLEQKKEIALEDTLAYPHIYFSEKSGLREIVDSLFSKIQERPNIVYEVEEDSAMSGLVANGFGIAILPNIPLLSSINVTVLKIKSPIYERWIYLGINKKQKRTPLLDDFIAYIEQHAQNTDI